MPAPFRRALIGLVLGVAGGALALMIAYGRASLVAGGRRGAPFVAQDPAALAPFFLVAFALGGGLLGLLAPLRRTQLGAFALGLIAAAGFIVTVFVGLEGDPASWSRSIWWAVAASTFLVGLILGGQLQPSES